MRPTLSKKLMRSLPTLTEVVDAPLAAAAPASGLDEDALARRVLQRLEQTLDAQVQKVVADALQEQMKELAPRIRQRVDNAVRKAVTQAMTAETAVTKPAGSRGK